MTARRNILAGQRDIAKWGGGGPDFTSFRVMPRKAARLDAGPYPASAAKPPRGPRHAPVRSVRSLPYQPQSAQVIKKRLGIGRVAAAGGDISMRNKKLPPPSFAA